MTRSNKSPSKLPQRQETWYLAVRELRIWITPPDEEPSQPYVALMVNLDQGIIQSFDTYPSPPTRPAFGDGERRDLGKDWL